MEELLHLVTKFNEDTWLDFYDAVRRFYEYIDEDLLSSVPFTEEQLKEWLGHTKTKLIIYSKK